MLTLKKILEVLQEQDGLETVIEFPNENMTISIFRNEKKLVFAPQLHHSLTSKVRTYVNMLKQKFNILRVNNLDDEEDEMDPNDDNLRGTFEVEVDPREDFESVVDFVKQQIDLERE